VTAQLTVTTNLFTSHKFNLTGHTVPPKVISDEPIDFGMTQIGGFHFKSIHLKNPFQEPLKVNIYVGRTIYDD